MVERTTKDGILTSVEEEHRIQFRNEGWTVIRNLVSGAALAELQENIAAAAEDEELLPPAGGRRADQATAEYQKVLIVRRDLARKYAALTEFKYAIGGVASDLLDGAEIRLWGDRIFAKPPAAEGGLPTLWHQDLPKLPVDRRGYLSIWIAVNDVTLEQGPLTFLPGSHHLGPLGAVSQLDDSELDIAKLLTGREAALLAKPVTTPLKAGDASVHDGLTLHCASRNVTDRERRAWTISYIPNDVLYDGKPDHHTDGLGIGQYKPFDHAKFPLVA